MEEYKSIFKEKQRKRMIIEVIGIIIIILLLITSCTGYNYFGKIGKFKVEKDIPVNPDNKNIEIIRNDNLKFEVDDSKGYESITLEDGNYHIGFRSKGILSNNYVCTSSDESIAKCVVKDGYVDIIPFKKGKVTITLSIEENNKKYVTEIDIEIISKKKNNNYNPKDNKDIITSESSTGLILDMKVDGFNLRPNFDRNIYDYILVVPTSTNKVKFDLTLSKKARIISGDKEVELKHKTTIHQFVVQEGDKTSTYTIKIIKDDNQELSSDNKLVSLNLENYTLTPDFNSDVLEYHVKVPYEKTSITVSGAPSDDNALVTVKGNSNLKVGNNKVVVTVTALDGSKKEYIINVERLDKTTLSSDATLKELAVNKYNLSPDFDPNTYSYNLTIDLNVSQLDIIAKTSDSKAKVEIIGNNFKSVGNYKVIVRVTAEDKTSKDYIINVLKEDNINNYYADSATNLISGYKTGEDNYKNIIINSNVLNNNIKAKVADKKITLTDGINSIELETLDDLTFEYIEGSNNSYVIKVKYNSIGDKKITLKATRGDKALEFKEILLSVKNKYYVILDANNGFFKDIEGNITLEYLEGEVLSLSEYNKAYKNSEENCQFYTLESYNLSSDGLGQRYELTDSVNITSDLKLFAIYSTTNKEVIEKEKRMYVYASDMFTKEDGSKGKIEPGSLGSYILHIKNNEDKKIKLKDLRLQEDNVCVDGFCLNMGYVLRKTNEGKDAYYFGNVDDYKILNSYTSPENRIYNLNDTYTSYKDISLNDIEIDVGEEIELSILWKWVDHEQDYKIGRYVIDHNDTYYLTISINYEVEENMC